MKKTFFEELKKDIQARKFGFRQIVAFTLLGMIVMVFVFFGYSIPQSGSVGSAAQVNKSTISLVDFQRQYSQLEQQYAQFLKMLGDSREQREFIKNQALDALVNQESAYQVSQMFGLKVSQPEIIKVITQDYEVFQDQGRFQRERYEGVLRANQWGPADFEKRISKERAILRLQKMMEISLTPPVEMVKTEKEISLLKRVVSFISWDIDSWTQQMKPNAVELTKLLNEENFKKKVESEFEQKKPELAQKEQVKAQHILIKFESGNKKSEEQALIQIMQLRNEALKGNFSQLAKEFSQDEASRSKGGDLGYFSKGQMDPEFESVAFASVINEVSQPVKSAFGYHLILVTDKKPFREAQWEDHSMKLAQQVWAREQYEGQVKLLEELLQKNEYQQVEKKLLSLGFKWQDSGFFSLAESQAGALTSEVVIDKSWELSMGKPWMSQLIRDGGRLYFVKLKEEKKDSAPKTEVELTQSLKESFANEAMSRLIDEFKKESKIWKNSQL